MSTVARLRTQLGSQPISKQRLRLWLRLLRASRAIEAKLRDRLRITFEITLPQFDVVAALARHDNGMTMTELSRELMVSNGNVTGIIDRLVTEKLVLRKALAEDRRTFIVRLTPKGAAHFDETAKIHERWIDEMLRDVGDAEAAAMIGWLDGLTSRVRNGGAPT